MANKNVTRYVRVSNGKDVLTVDTVGAQIVSWKVDGLEVMYRGAMDSKRTVADSPEPRWSATAKNLFPNPGPMGKTNSRFGTPILDEQGNFTGEYVLPKDGKVTTYYHNGGVYQMGQHGFAQDEEYKVLSKVELNNKTGECYSCDRDLVLTISDELNDTAGKYPYKFSHSLVYSVPKAGALNYEAHAINNDNKPMVAGQGWHPAFKLHGNPEDYRLKIVNLKKKKGCKDDCQLQEGQIIDIYADVISQDKSVHFGGIAEADYVLLYKKPNGEVIEYLTMHSTEPELILWSRKALEEGQESFIAIEPWNSPSRTISELTTQDKTLQLAQKGAVVVEPAMTAYQKQDVIDRAESDLGKLSEYDRKTLREHLQTEDSVLSAGVKVNPEYIKEFANADEFFPGCSF